MKANLKKLISVSLCLLLLLGSVAAGGAGISEALDSFTLKASAENDSEDFTFSYEEDYAVVTGYTGESESITIPEEAEGLPVKEIGAGAFSGVNYIRELFIPASVISVGANAFDGCRLSSIYYYGRPGALAVDSTGNDSFNQSAIRYKYAPFTFTVNETESTAEITDCDKSVTGILEIPSEIYSYTVTSVGYYAVDYCQNITGVILPSTLKTIGTASFYNCQSLKEVTVPEGVTKVDYTAFMDCKSLERISFPSTAVSIDRTALNNCTSLKYITVAEGNAKYKAVENCLIDTETKTLMRGTNLSVTPSGEEITSIGTSAFSNCMSMTAFGIPDTVTSIGDYAFQNTSLLSITIPAGVTEIGVEAFNNCESLNVIAVNSDSIRRIGPNAFKNCGYCNDSSNAENGVFYISSRNVSYAVAVVPDIEGKVTLKNNTGFIADNVFDFKRNITQAVLPSGLETIGGGAFYACSGLGSINIPASVTEIGSYAFEGCDSLSEAFYEGTREQWDAVNVSEYGNDALFNALRFADDSIEFRAVNFTLGGDIGFNLYFKIPDADEQTYTKFSYDGKTINAPINLDSEKNIDGGEEGIFYRFTCTVPAADVSKTISVTVVTGSGYKFAGELSVNYCLEYLQNDSQYSNDADLMNLIGALADYGRYAHELFEPQEDFDSATIGSYQDSIDSVTAASAANNPLTLENNGGVKYAGMSLVLRTKTAIRFYFTLPKGKSIEDYSFTAAGPGLGDDGAALTPVQKGSRWYVEISDIPSAELGTNYTVSVYKGENAVNTWTGSAFSYVNQVLGAPEGTFGSALINACKALYNYGKYAAVYFA